MLKIGNNIIVNTDDISDIKSINTTKYVIITCGLKLNSTITASSINDDGFTFCLQRTIFTISGKTLSPQEFNVKWFKKPDDIFESLAYVTTMLLCDISPEVFNIIKF